MKTRGFWCEACGMAFVYPFPTPTLPRCRQCSSGDVRPAQVIIADKPPQVVEDPLLTLRGALDAALVAVETAKSYLVR